VETEKSKSNTNKGMYVLPNLFTTGALFAAFYSLIAAINSNFEIAAIAIFVSALLDSLDGRVARMTNTQSAFGAEYDSLADIVSFGVCPGLVVYLWSLSSLNQIGWLVSFIFVASCGLRLARFNSSPASSSKRYFYGLPSPSAAAVIAGLVWVAGSEGTTSLTAAIFVAILTFFLALMMVSNVKYRSFKDYDLKGSKGFTPMFLVVLVIAFIALSPAYVLFIVFFLYALSGPAAFLYCKIMGKSQDEEEEISEAEKP
jgi:CDP-diacylglycerol--serine O-phosphatidyltransferase